MTADSSLISRTARDILMLLERREVSPLDLLDSLEQRIGTVDGAVNALPTLCFDRARAAARAHMEKDSAEQGLLAGIPVAIKDLAAVEGVRTTYGSPIPTALRALAKRAVVSWWNGRMYVPATPSIPVR